MIGLVCAESADGAFKIELTVMLQASSSDIKLYFQDGEASRLHKLDKDGNDRQIYGVWKNTIGFSYGRL